MFDHSGEKPPKDGLLPTLDRAALLKHYPKNGNEQAEPEPKSSAKIARLRENGKKKGEKMNAWNLSRQSTMNCVPTDNLTINSFVTYKRSELCEVRLRFCSTSKRTPPRKTVPFP